MSSREVDECKPLGIVEAAPNGEEHNIIGEAAAVPVRDAGEENNIVSEGVPTRGEQGEGAEVVAAEPGAIAEKEAEGALSDAAGVY
jgi:hypothetical protein